MTEERTKENTGQSILHTLEICFSYIKYKLFHTKNTEVQQVISVNQKKKKSAIGLVMELHAYLL